MKIFAFLLFVLTSGSTYTATDITGHWTGNIMGQFDISYDFKQEGEKLTGSTIGPDGNKLDINNGSVKGDDVKFSIDLNGAPMVIAGKVKGNVINLSFNMNGEDVPFEIKRAEK